MTDDPARGALSQMAMDAELPFDGSSEAFEFLSSTLKRTDTHARSDGIRGTRSRFSSRVRIAQKAIAGAITLNPSVTELDLLWPRILGGTTAGGVTDVDDNLPKFQVMVDEITKVFTFTECKVSRCTISGTSGNPIQVVLDIEGTDEVITAEGGFPSLTIDTDNMFVFSDLSLTLLGTTRFFSSFTLVIDNLLDTGRFNNSLTRAEIAAQDRLVTLQVDTPYTSDNADLYDAVIAGAAGILAMNDGTTTYTFDFGNVKAENDGPEVNAKGEILLPINMMCYKDGANSEIKVTKTTV